jgi:hypothetical protein
VGPLGVDKVQSRQVAEWRLSVSYRVGQPVEVDAHEQSHVPA